MATARGDMVVHEMSDAGHVEAPTSQAGTDENLSGVSDKPSRGRRLAHVLAAILVAVVLPALLMNVLIGTLGAYALLTGLLLGVAGSRIGGTRRMTVIAPATGVAAALGAFTAYDWWWATLVAST